jgi:hypothetical protein
MTNHVKSCANWWWEKKMWIYVDICTDSELSTIRVLNKSPSPPQVDLYFRLSAGNSGCTHFPSNCLYHSHTTVPINDYLLCGHCNEEFVRTVEFSFVSDGTTFTRWYSRFSATINGQNRTKKDRKRRGRRHVYHRSIDRHSCMAVI